MKIVKTILIIIVIGILTGALFFVFQYRNEMTLPTSQDMEKLEQQAQPYEDEIAELQDKIDEIYKKHLSFDKKFRKILTDTKYVL